jgi:predicted house-cleaning noncanonical NTP pyrophosphatase (MazG superfamily)
MVEYDKLVRDRIPEIIRAAGKIPVTRTVADAEEMKRRLLDKLAEEMQEYRESGSVEEIADIMEVIEALVEQVHGLKWEDVREIQGRKWEVRGGFDAGIVLERVEG